MDEPSGGEWASQIRVWHRGKRAVGISNQGYSRLIKVVRAKTEGRSGSAPAVANCLSSSAATPTERRRVHTVNPT